ncbi:MAG: RidA family protein, partial [Caulobacteraceae bacterium]
MSTPQDNLARLNIVLAPPTAAGANHVPLVRHGTLVHLSGQVSVDAGGGILGVVGGELDLAAGQAAARLCAINLIAQM